MDKGRKKRETDETRLFFFSKAFMDIPATFERNVKKKKYINKNIQVTKANQKERKPEYYS